MARFRSVLKWGYLVVLLPSILAVSAWQGYQWWYWAIAPIAVAPEGQTQNTATLQVEIPQNTSTRQIGTDLAAMGLVRSAWAWNLWASYLSLQEQDGSFKAGTYLISPHSDMKTIAQTIWTGQVMTQSFTIPEGWSLQQMGDYFAEQGYFSQEDFLKAAGEIPREQFAWLPENLTSLEGFLYPDTYQLPNAKPQPADLIQLMLKQFETVVLPVWQAQTDVASAEINSLLDWVTLASIVEKEAVIPAERPIIAGVFVKRLQLDMKLEADPTVEYAFGITQTQEQPLTLAQVQQPSPYNTYVNPGLPPGPIASPRLESLQAVLNPEVTDFLYFVARYDGTHVFSKTEAEHDAAKAEVQNTGQ